MARVINTNSPGKRRKSHMRTIAEILRHLGQKNGIDDHSKDMVAAVIYNLRAIAATVEESSVAWEKRGYWKKADDFQQKWWWASLCSTNLEKLVRSGDWQGMPEAMFKLFPHFADIKINRLTRDPSNWSGLHDKLMGELEHSS